MALLKQCFCYSLRQASFCIGSYSLVVYCVAFAVELWWIVEAQLMLPAPAYTLGALYFFNFVMAAVLLFGLLVRQKKYLMSWSLMTVLAFFPEAGMVLFMSLYFWPTQRYEYGVIELIYWSLRAIFNIFGALCVCSLYLTWRDEQMILGRLHDLTLANVENGSNSVNGFHTTAKPYNLASYQRNTLSNNNSIGFQNFGYVDSTNLYSTGCGDCSLKPAIRRASQSFTSHQRQPPPQMSHFPRQILSRASITVPSMKSEFNPATIFDPNYQQFNHLSSMGINEMGIEPLRDHESTLHKAKSLRNLSYDDYYERPPLSRPVSLGFVNHNLNLENSYNYNTMMKQGIMPIPNNKNNWIASMGRKAQSVDGLNNFYRFYGPNIIANSNNYRLATEWSKSSLNLDSDENYGDDDLGY